MHPHLAELHAYPFEKLAKYTAQWQLPHNTPLISLAIGEPKHPTPDFLLESLIKHQAGYGQYPSTIGLPLLRESIAAWLNKRFEINTNPSNQILPVNGTREALFSAVQALVNPRTKDNKNQSLVLMPNPGYQIYEGAALLAGAKPVYLPCLAANNYLPDLDQIDEKTWQDCALLFLCSPGNPTGAVADINYLKKAILLSQKYNFIIASDECYSELYLNEAVPPAGLLTAAMQLGVTDFANCLVFHSLSKRSNAPGLRSGFVAGEARLINAFLRYRTYHGCAMSIPVQHASALAWSDESHVLANRDLYRQKFDLFQNQLHNKFPNLHKPEASFYYWLKVDDDLKFVQNCYEQAGILAIPGRFLSRNIDDFDPGLNYVRLSLVASLDETNAAISRLLNIF